MARRTRLAPDQRRRQLLDAADTLVIEEGALPLPADALATAAGVSKALVYAYFPTQHDLANAVLERRFDDLRTRGLDAAAVQPTVEAAARACALIYFDHVAEAGPAIHVILRDRYMAGHVAPALAAWRDRIVRRLARAARTRLNLSSSDVVAAVGMVMTIPEEAGRLAFAGELERQQARALCQRLVDAAVEALVAGA